MGFCRAGVQTQCRGKLVSRFVVSSSFLQGRRIIKMRPHTGRKISSDCPETLHFTLGGVQLREPNRCKGENEDSYPFRSVQRPTWDKSLSYNINGASADANR